MNFLYFLELLDDFFSVIERLFDRVGQWLSDLWDAFPNPLRMADVSVEFFTGVVGLVLGVVTTPLWRNMRRNATKVCRGKLARPEEVLRWMEEALIDAVQQISMTSEQGLTAWLVQRISVWLWHLFKRFKKILAIIRIRELADVVKIVKSAFKYRITVLSVIGMMAVVILLIATALNISAAVGFFYVEKLPAYCLSQDSRRVRRTRRNVQFRVNERAGPDRPG